MPARVAALGAGGAPLPPSRPPPPALGLTRPRLPFASPAAPPPPPSSSLAPLRGRLTRASQVPGLSPAGSAGSTSARLLCICTNIREGGRLELLHLKAPNKALQGVSGRWQRYVGVAWGDRRSPGKPQTIGRGDPLTVRARWPLNELRSVWWESGRAEFWLAFRAPGGEEAGGVRVGEGGEVHGFSIADSRGGERFVQQLLDICPGSARAIPPSGICARSERPSPASPGGGGPGHLSGGGGGAVLRMQAINRMETTARQRTHMLSMLSRNSRARTTIACCFASMASSVVLRRTLIRPLHDPSSRTPAPVSALGPPSTLDPAVPRRPSCLSSSS